MTRLFRMIMFAAAFSCAGATAGQAAPVSFSFDEEDGISSVDSGTLTFDSADPSAGTITFGRFLVGDPEFAPPSFSANTVGAIKVSIAFQTDAIIIDASGTGEFTFDDGTKSGGSLSAHGIFVPDNPPADTLSGFGSIGAQSTTGISAAATNGGYLYGALSLAPTTVPLPPSAPLFGAALLALFGIDYVNRRGKWQAA